MEEEAKAFRLYGGGEGKCPQHTVYPLPTLLWTLYRLWIDNTGITGGGGGGGGTK